MLDYLLTVIFTFVPATYFAYVMFKAGGDVQKALAFIVNDLLNGYVSVRMWFSELFPSKEEVAVADKEEKKEELITVFKAEDGVEYMYYDYEGVRYVTFEQQSPVVTSSSDVEPLESVVVKYREGDVDGVCKLTEQSSSTRGDFKIMKRVFEMVSGPGERFSSSRRPTFEQLLSIKELQEAAFMNTSERTVTDIIFNTEDFEEYSFKRKQD